MLALTYELNHPRWLTCKALARLRPQVCWSMLAPLKLREVPMPQLPSPQWVRLKTRLGGICGTDLSMVLLRQHPATFLRSLTSFPILMGHENVAEIDEVGPEVGPWKVGQRVCVEPALSCTPRGVSPLCNRCQAGEFSLCENVDGGGLPSGVMIGLNCLTGGSWSPYFVAHHSQLHAVPDSVSDPTAVLVDPLACAMHAVLRRQPQNDVRVLIIGGGFIGLAIMKSMTALGHRAEVTGLVRDEAHAFRLRNAGAKLVIVSPGRESRRTRYDRVASAVGGRRIPGKFGNQMLLGGYDVVYDCVGSAQSFTDALKFARGRGTVVLVGTSQIGKVDTTPVWFSELNIVGANGRQIESLEGRREHTYEIVFRLLVEGKLAISDLTPTIFPLQRYREAFAALIGPARQRPIKAAFDPG